MIEFLTLMTVATLVLCGSVIVLGTSLAMVPSVRRYLGLDPMRPLVKRYRSKSDDMRDAWLWWAYSKGRFWGAGICIPVPRGHWAWRFAYMTRYASKRWYAQQDTFRR